MPRAVIARRLRHYRDGHLVIAPCAFRREVDGRVRVFNDKKAITDDDLRAGNAPGRDPGVDGGEAIEALTPAFARASAQPMEAVF